MLDCIQIHGENSRGKELCCELLLQYLDNIFFRETLIPFKYYILMPTMFVRKMRKNQSELTSHLQKIFPSTYFSLNILGETKSHPQYQIIEIKGNPNIVAYIISTLYEQSLEKFKYKNLDTPQPDFFSEQLGRI